MGEEPDHVRLLSVILDKVPPIIVHRSTMRVVDGMHRLRAAQLRGDDTIEVQFFDGTEHEAFVLAVRLNIAHGLPLSLADRTAAAKRIIADNPAWSDRAIAATVGLGARTVGNLRRRFEPDGETTAMRVGKDGRVRPVDHTAGRKRAAEYIADNPDASLREIARHASVSPSTARDVRQRVQRGDDPLAIGRIRAAERPGPAGEVPRVVRHPPGGPAAMVVPDRGAPAAQSDEPEPAALIRGLQRDPALRFTESGRFVLRWIAGHVVQSGEWSELVEQVPAHSAYLIADLARLCAAEWHLIADDMERRIKMSA